MSTNSQIAVQHEDGSISEIYCHWDGYLAYNGRILLTHYNSLELAESLVSLGDLSLLGSRIHPTGPHTFDNPEPDTCIYYNRDRNESDIEPTKYDSLNDYMILFDHDYEYNYMFANGCWNLVFKKQLIPITEEMIVNSD